MLNSVLGDLATAATYPVTGPDGGHLLAVIDVRNGGLHARTYSHKRVLIRCVLAL